MKQSTGQEIAESELIATLRKTADNLEARDSDVHAVFLLCVTQKPGDETCEVQQYSGGTHDGQQIVDQVLRAITFTGSVGHAPVQTMPGKESPRSH